MGRMNHKLSLGTTPIVRCYVIYVSDFITPRNSGVDPSLQWGRGWVCDQGVCDHGGAGVHTPRLTPSPPHYGKQTGGMHPTGMFSCGWQIFEKSY